MQFNLRNITKLLILTALAVHLFSNNAQLLSFISPDELGTWHKMFNFIKAVSYSLITVYLLAVYPRLWLIILLAIFDGIGVAMFIRNDEFWTKLLNFYGSFYYGGYTFLIVISLGIIEWQRSKKPAEIKQAESKPEQKENLPENTTELNSEADSKTKADDEQTKANIKRLQLRINATKNPEKKAELNAELNLLKAKS